jgi:hypothetical protein
VAVIETVWVLRQLYREQMPMNKWPLVKIFWTIFGLEALAALTMLALALMSFSRRSGPDGGMVGAWIVLIPVAALGLVGGLFLAVKAPWARVLCIVLLLWPLVGPVVGAPVLFLKKQLEAYRTEQSRVGRNLFPEEGQRRLAAAIANHDVAGVKAALPGAADLNRSYSQKLPYSVPLGDAETMLSFACQHADESDAAVEIVRSLLQAGANPNLPAGLPLSAAIFRSVRVTEELLRAGADIGAVDGYGQPVWWYAVGHEAKNVEMLAALLRHEADLAQRNRIGTTVLEYAAESEWWRSVYLLAQFVPGGKDLVLGRSTLSVSAKLAEEVHAMEESGQEVPADMKRAMAAFAGRSR